MLHFLPYHTIIKYYIFNKKAKQLNKWLPTFDTGIIWNNVIPHIFNKVLYTFISCSQSYPS